MNQKYLCEKETASQKATLPNKKAILGLIKASKKK